MPTKTTTKSRTKKIAAVENPKAESFNVKIYDLKGAETESISVAAQIFNAKVNQRLLTQYMHVYLTNQRQGTASTKTRSEVTASSKKIYRQKGTGRARHGAISAPIFVGGGVAGGPKPKEYSLKLNKKQKKAALFSSLTMQFKQGNIIGLTDEIRTIEPKTKVAAATLSSVLPNKEKSLIVLPDLKTDNFALAVRNLQNIDLVDARNINPYLILKHRKIIFLKNALQVLEDHFLKTNAT